MITLLTPENGSIVCQLQQKHIDYIREPKNDPTAYVDYLNLYNVQDDLSFPEPTIFTFTPAIDGTIVLCHAEDKKQFIRAVNGKASVQNLLLDTEYEWYVEANGERSEVSHFRTDAQPPRVMYVDGLSNVRDFGGFKTTDGKRIKQDMIYRTTELDCHLAITPEGIRTLEDELKIRTDLDIRGVGSSYKHHPILDQSRVQWINFPLAAYVNVFTEEQVNYYGQSYAILADEAVYPLIVHCFGGIDRTGTWLYILGAMLGVSENDLGLDYEFSSFSRWGCRSRRSEQFLEFLNGLYKYGDTLQKAAIGFMKAGGLTDEQLDKIRKLLLTEH